MRALLLVLVACGSGVSPRAVRYDRCEAVAQGDDVVKAVVVQRCTEDAWECQPHDDLEACRSRLDDAQNKKLAAELDEVESGLVLGKLAALETQMCACKPGNKGCAAHVRDAWLEIERKYPPREGDHQRAELTRAAQKCEARASHEDAMAAMERFKDELCACKDKACAEGVQNEMSQFAEAHKDMKDMKMSDDEMKRATEIGMAMAQCMSKLYNAGP